MSDTNYNGYQPHCDECNEQKTCNRAGICHECQIALDVAYDTVQRNKQVVAKKMLERSKGAL